MLGTHFISQLRRDYTSLVLRVALIRWVCTAIPIYFLGFQEHLIYYLLAVNKKLGIAMSVSLYDFEVQFNLVAAIRIKFRFSSM